jgi:hypothetical protein
MIGFFLAPIYPALGGTFGSIITGNFFEIFEGKTAFYLSVIPIVGLMILLSIFNKQLKNSNK